MVMCSKCNKRVAVIFTTYNENGETKSRGYCIKCAKEMGLPVDNMLGGVFGKFGLDPEQIEDMEDNMNDMIAEYNDGDEGDDGNDGRAPAIDFGKLMGEAGNVSGNIPKGNGKAGGKDQKKKKYLDTYCRNLTESAKKGELDKIIGREKELGRVIQILCRRHISLKISRFTLLILPRLLRERNSEDSLSRECRDL